MTPPDCLIHDGRVVTPTGIREGSVLVRDGRIARVGKVGKAEAARAQCVDATGRLVLPGLIDVHIQGAGGSDLLQDDPDAVHNMRCCIAAFGTTSFLATTAIDVTQREQPHIRRIVDSIENDRDGARILGIHLEGPFISREKKGMIQERFICAADRARHEEIKKDCGGYLRMMTIAPEIPGALELIRDTAACGIVAALGHTNATYEETLRGIEAGLTHVTHTMNAMRSFHHREPGALGAVLMTDALTMQIICDGVHLHPAVVAWLVRLKGPSRCAIITDGITAVGLPEGRYEYAGLSYTVRDGTAWYENGTLIGTAMTQLQMVRRACRFTGLPVEQVVPMASLFPARILGIADRKGSIEAGKDADLVVCDDELAPVAVFVEGRPVPPDI